MTTEERAKEFGKKYKALCKEYNMELHATVNPGLKLIDTLPDEAE